ncbi:TonB-dependent receptor domain-containing protein [Sphingomonas hankyongi]|uniref:TonB-dependent receptor n=1 Tax=Sphingomonas hankyongi TaxID=2908209 RepID=A0ABT0S348_9SPHN|nr:TonB-dependent receptor [Sphingomonas hankyongi]MCL6730054.1 TonB-dependent receptor [Sphingomonas hankyongi]
MRISKTQLLATTFIAGVAFAAPAFAQSTDPQGPSQDPNVQAAPTDQTPATQENPADTAAQGAQDTEKGSAETIVVTGSRIVSPNIVSLAPVQVVGEADIDKSGAVNVQEVLLENPAFGTPAVSTTNSAFSTSGAGAATIDLRDFGSNRTLVLINNRRVVGGFGGSPIVDLNVIPTQFIERIDVLTGGASSLYGSDAVAGVVNFIYKRNFQGLLAEGQYGITEKGDYPRYQMNVTAGANFAEDRGNLMFHLGYSDDKGLLSRQRKNTRVDDIDYFQFSGNPDDYGTPYEPFFSSFTPQGRFFTSAGSFTFDQNGVLRNCFSSNGSSCGGAPNGFNRQFFRTLSTPVKRWLVAERGHFDITDNISFITEATYSKVAAKTEIEPVPLDVANIFVNTARAPVQSLVQGPNGPVIVDNPLVPAAILAASTDTDGDGLKDIGFSRRLLEFGTRNYTADRDFFRFVTGFEGKLFNDRWNRDVTYNFGRTEEQQVANGDVNIQNFQHGFAAVRETAATGDLNGNGALGDIVCADAEARAEGCVPINIFGAGAISQAAVNYIKAESNHSFKVTQQVFNANLSGAIIDLPAGPLGVAIGGEYRKEKSEENWDALTNAGLLTGNALPDTSGQFNVKEAYGEINVPILANMSFAHQLNLRAAGRISDYSTIGSVTTWNVGADWAPIEDIRFRGTYAKAVRAPNIGELFTGPSQTFPTGLQDPCADIDPGTAGQQGVTLTSTGTVSEQCRATPGVIANINANGGVFTLTQADKQGVSGFTSGNPNLGPEKSKSLTLGVVINPKSFEPLRNLVLSVDYFKIKLTDAISFFSRQTILNQCYQDANAAFCQFITRFPTATGSASPGALQFINVGGVNASKQNVEGIDTVLSYRTGLDSLLTGLTANARIAWTHYLKGALTELPGEDPNRQVGEIGTARDKANGTIAFNTRQWGVSFTGTYIGKSYEDDVFLSGFGLDDKAVKIDPEFYLDTQLSFTPVRNYEFFFGVDNLLDNKAPNILSGSPFNNTGADTAASVYDIFGRRYYAGARLRF